VNYEVIEEVPALKKDIELKYKKFNIDI